MLYLSSNNEYFLNKKDVSLNHKIKIFKSFIEDLSNLKKNNKENVLMVEYVEKFLDYLIEKSRYSKYYLNYSGELNIDQLTIVYKESVSKFNRKVSINKTKYKYLNENLEETLKHINNIKILLNNSKYDDFFFAINDLKSYNFEQINLKDFKLRELKHEVSIEDKSLYYAIYDNKFISQEKTRHGRTLYGWSLSPKESTAFLFNGELGNYNLPYDLKRVNKVFVNVKLIGVEENVASNLLEEIKIKMNKKEIDNLLDINKKTKKTNKL